MSIQENLDKVTAGLTAVNNHDVDGFVNLLEPGFKLFLIVKPAELMPQAQVSGAQDFADYLHKLYAAFTDLRFEQCSVSANGNMVYQELNIIGTHAGPLVLPNGREIPPTHASVNLKTEIFHTFNNQGGYVSNTGYLNLGEIMTQLKA